MIFFRHIYWVFLSILLTPESVFVFVSGIFLSSAINIATGVVNIGGISQLPLYVIISMSLMFLTSIIFMILAVIIKPIQESYKNMDITTKVLIKQEKKDNAWYHLIHDYRPCFVIILPLLLIFALVSCVSSILVLFMPNILNSINPIDNVP